jgi:hypothetical protein
LHLSCSYRNEKKHKQRKTQEQGAGELALESLLEPANNRFAILMLWLEGPKPMNISLKVQAYKQGWPKPYICTVYDRKFGGLVVSLPKYRIYPVNNLFWPTPPVNISLKVARQY